MAAIPVTEILEHIWQLLTTTSKFLILILLGFTAYKKNPESGRWINMLKTSIESTIPNFQRHITYGAVVGGILTYISGEKIIGIASILGILGYGLYKKKEDKIQEKEIDGWKSYIGVLFAVFIYALAAIGVFTNLPIIENLVALGIIGVIFWKL
ncbi:MAG: hypothetical protein MUP58_01235 [Candidatus Nanohaloarchaeota archaeon QJJ-9]|nr:hypothetical protein [Candidatus Nanohaloarchaeota archaeon QJJ-9]